MNEQEPAFIRQFIIKEKQERYLGFLSAPKKRRKFMAELYHRLAFRSALAVEVPSNKRNVGELEQQLRQRGSKPEVYVISPESDLDQQWHPLGDALQIVIGTSSEAIVCCRLGELAFYKSEDSAWILQAEAGGPFDGRGKQ